MLLSVLLTMALASSPTQDHRSWSSRDGLPVDHLTGLTIAHDGRLVIATVDGLVYFDGVRFDRVTVRDGLPTSRLAGVMTDMHGRLWVRTSARQLLVAMPGERVPREVMRSDTTIPGFPIVTETETLVATDAGVRRWTPDGLDELVEPGLTSLLGGEPGDLWAADEGAVVHLVHGESTRYDLARLPATPRAVVPLSSGGALAHTRRGIVILVDGEVLPLQIDGAPMTSWTAGITPSGPNEYYASSHDGPLILTCPSARACSARHVNEDIPGVSITQTPARTVHNTPRGRWLVTGDAVYFNGNLAFSADKDVHGRIDQAVSDRHGNLWLGTDRDGLHLLRAGAVRTIDALQQHNIHSIAHDGPVTWVGTFGQGLFRIRGDETERIDGRWRYTLALLPQDGHVLVGSLGRGLVRVYDDGSHDNLGLSIVRALHRSRDGHVLVGAYSGTYRLRGSTLVSLGGPGGARAFHEDEHGLWVATDGSGLWRYQDGQWDQVDFPSSLPRWFYADREGLWVGTEDRGLIRVVDGDRFIQVKGLPVDGVHALAGSGETLLGSSNQGLFAIQRSELHQGELRSVRMLTEFDGLTSREANGGASSATATDDDGMIWFPTQRGVALVDPATVLHVNEVPPRVQLTPTPIDGRLDLPASGGQVTLGITAADPGEAFRASGRYRLLPNPAWNPLASDARAVLAELPPGEHVLEAQASKVDGTWSPTVRYPIQVAYHWWQTTVAWVGALLLVLALGIGIFMTQRRLARVQRARLERLVASRTRDLEQTRDEAIRSRDTVVEQARELERLARVRARFFANVSHELRTPLTLLLAPLRQVQGEVNSRQAEPIDLAVRSTQRLMSLVDQLMDVARIESDRIELERQPRDVAPWLEEQIRRFSPLAERAQVALSHVPSEQALRAEVDGEQLEKIFGNLLANALKFTPPGGSVVVRGALVDDTVIVDVVDDGPGIAPESLDILFEPFSRPNQERLPHLAGTGLGLALARELARLHGGQLRVLQTSDEGTTFRLELPATHRQTVPWGASAALGATPWSAAPQLSESQELPVVLVVDDHPDIRSVVANVLATEARVRVANDGVEALEQMAVELPDLVLSDVMMPRMDGLQLLRHLRAEPEFAFVPFVLLSARTDVASRVEGLDAGADDYLPKPFEPDELRARLRSVLRRRPSQPSQPAVVEQQTIVVEQQTTVVEQHAPVAQPETSANLPVMEQPSARAPAPSADEVYLERLGQLIADHLHDPEFGVEALAKLVHQDRSQLYRRVQALTGQTPSRWIRNERLERAALQLRDRSGTVSEIAYAVGFKNVSSFSRSFKQQYGSTPTRFAAKQAQDEARSASLA